MLCILCMSLKLMVTHVTHSFVPRGIAVILPLLGVETVVSAFGGNVPHVCREIDHELVVKIGDPMFRQPRI